MHSPKHYPHAVLAAHAATRPPGYMDELAPAIIAQDEAGVTYDLSHAAWVAAVKKYSSPKPIESDEQRAARLASTGRALWLEAHTKENPDAAWFTVWMGRIPCGICGSKAKRYVAANTPQFGPDWPLWIWKFHQHVNSELGKPGITFDEALRLYTPTPGSVSPTRPGACKAC